MHQTSFFGLAKTPMIIVKRWNKLWLLLFWSSKRKWPIGVCTDSIAFFLNDE